MNYDPLQLHHDTLVADLHCDAVLQMRRGYDISQRHDRYHVDLPRLREGGINLQVFACVADASVPDDRQFEAVDGMFDMLHTEFEKNSGQVAACRTATEAEEIIASGRIAAFLAVEGGAAIANDLSKLEHFYRRLSLIHI